METNGQECETIGGPFFDELEVGQVFDSSPSMTLTDGVAALHQSIVGDRLRLSLDASLSAAVTGGVNALAHPALVCDVAIGQSTLATQRVKANLFYRGLAFHRFVELGDSLSTRTEVVGMKQNSSRRGRESTGLVALHVTTVDQWDRPVLDFYRCAMLPLAPGITETGRCDDLSVIDVADRPIDPTCDWDVAAFRARVPGPYFTEDLEGRRLRSAGDVVSSAPELARLSLNVASTHHDWRSGGRRLVYGGHTIGIALAQANRMIPNLVTVLAWQSCDHIGPVREDDTLYSDLYVQSAIPRPQGGGVLSLRSMVYATGDEARQDRLVLDWHYTALML